MISVVTLNPAVDKTVGASSLFIGEVNRMNTVKNLAGGKGVNVCKVLRTLGMDVRALGLCGGYAGKSITDYLSHIGAIDAFSEIREETRTNINVISEEGVVTEILEPGPTIRKEEWEQFLRGYEAALLQTDYMILSGSIPKGLETDTYRKLIHLATQKGVPVLLDTSGPSLKEGIEAMPFMVKPNKKELETLLGEKLETLSDIRKGALYLREKGIPHVLVSMGSMGMLYACENRVLYAKAPHIKVANTVGSGDSAVAAFAYAKKNGLSMEEILAFCVAVSAANVTTLDSAVIPMDKAKELLEQIETEEI